MARVNKKAEEKAIRALDKAWGDAATAHKAGAVASFYAQDGMCVWPDEKPIRGKAAILKAWTALCKDKKLMLKFTPTSITVADSGDLASDYGVCRGRFGTGTGSISAVFKYLVVWTKVRGTWKVLYDSYNFNAPLPAPSGGAGVKPQKKARQKK